LGNVLPVGRDATSVKEPRPNVLHEFTYARGDIDAALAAADHVFTDEFVFSRINPYHLESYINIANVVGDRIELWSCNQDPFLLRADISRIFGCPLNRVRIHTPYVGGGFGGKSYCKMEPLVVLLARKAGRAVKLELTMDEGLLTLTKHAALFRLTTGVMHDGTLVARRSEVQLDGGAYSDASISTTLKAGYRITGVYRWQAVATRAWTVRTNLVPGGSFRGFGGTQASFASESQIDMIARRLGMDPYTLRRRNLLRVGEEYAPGDSGMDSDLEAGLDHVAERLGYHARVSGNGRGMGLGIGIKDGGGTGLHGMAIVKVSGSGDIFVQTASVEIGQGAMTALGKIAADTLGLPLSRVRYNDLDTDYTPFDTGTHVSFATAINGTAVERAALSVREQLLAFAAERLECDPGALEMDGWGVRLAGALHPLKPMIEAYYGGAGTEFVGHGRMKTPYDAGAPLYSRNPFWIPAWAGAEVEVDRETGRVRVLKLVVSGDAGTCINPSACRGQIEGGGMQAFSQAMFEELVYEGEAPANAEPLLYRVLGAGDLPDVFESIVEEQGMGPGPGGAKGLGESGMLGIASAIANAIEDAVGVRVSRIPFSPERVLAALDAAAGEHPVTPSRLED
jgi:CO/xanthine dehydrogenase Mo-binding subunit